MSDGGESFCGHFIAPSADGRGFLVFRNGPFPAPRAEGFERARATSAEDARQIAMMLSCGMRAEGIGEQMRDARRCEASRERFRDGRNADAADAQHPGCGKPARGPPASGR